VRARMELRRLETRKAVGAVEAITNADTEQLQRLIANDQQHRDFLKKRDELTARINSLYLTATPERLAKSIEGPRRELEIASAHLERRREQLTEDYRAARARAVGEAGLLYWQRLRDCLEKDLATLRKELKALGG